MIKKKLRCETNFYILHIVILVLIDYMLLLCKTGSNKKFWPTNDIKMENNGLEKIIIKNRMRYYFEDIIKFKDFDADKILLDEKLTHNNMMPFIIELNILHD